MKTSRKLSRGKHLLAALALALLLAPAAALAVATEGGLQQQAGEAVPRLNIPIPGVDLTKPIRTNTSITVPFVAQYIAGVYKFLISIVGVVAAVMMMIGGFQYLTAGGDMGRVKVGREKIVNAIVGLVLALGSYVVLYVINPNLVTFEGLKVQLIEPEAFESEVHDEGDDASVGGTTAPVQGLCKSLETCKALCATHSSQWKTSAPGILDPAQAQVITNSTSLRNPKREMGSPRLVAALKTAASHASAEGYTIHVISALRPLTKQIKLVCDKYAAGKYSDVPKYVAYPGGSNHGTGNAVDVWLEKDGKNVTVASSAKQGEAEWREGAVKLGEFMAKAGFRRYAAEIWHYEISGNGSCRCTPPNCPTPPFPYPIPKGWCSLDDQIQATLGQGGYGGR